MDEILKAICECAGCLLNLFMLVLIAALSIIIAVLAVDLVEWLAF